MRAACVSLISIAYLHEHGLVHGDIHSLNVMLTFDSMVVLVDLGSSRVSAQVSRRWAMVHEPPEVLEHNLARHAVIDYTLIDVFMCGAVLYEVRAGRGCFSRSCSNSSFAVARDSTFSSCRMSLVAGISNGLPKDVNSGTLRWSAHRARARAAREVLHGRRPQASAFTHRRHHGLPGVAAQQPTDHGCREGGPPEATSDAHRELDLFGSRVGLRLVACTVSQRLCAIFPGHLQDEEDE